MLIEPKLLHLTYYECSKLGDFGEGKIHLWDATYKEEDISYIEK